MAGLFGQLDQQDIQNPGSGARLASLLEECFMPWRQLGSDLEHMVLRRCSHATFFLMTPSEPAAAVTYPLRRLVVSAALRLNTVSRFLERLPLDNVA